MSEWSRDAYIKQTLIYLQNEDYNKAYGFSKEFLEKNPDDMMAEFLVAKSAFWMDKFDEAIAHGTKAFNLAHSREDMALCAIVLASAYFKAEKYEEGHKLLKAVDDGKNEDVKKLLLLFSIALKKEEDIEKYMESLYEINSKIIEELLF